MHTIRNRLTMLRGDDAVERAFGVPLQEGGRRSRGQPGGLPHAGMNAGRLGGGCRAVSPALQRSAPPLSGRRAGILRSVATRLSEGR